MNEQQKSKHPWMYKLKGLDAWVDDESRRLTESYDLSSEGCIYYFNDLETNKSSQLIQVFGEVIGRYNRVFGFDGRSFNQFARGTKGVQINDENFFRHFRKWYKNKRLRVERYGQGYVVFLEEITIREMYRKKPTPPTKTKEIPLVKMVKELRPRR